MTSGHSLLAALVAAGLSGLPASAQETPTLDIGLQDEPDTLDPATNWSFVGRHVLQQICDKIVDIDENAELVPMIATDWSWNDDSTELTLTIREGTTFHDGTPLDAEAVRYNLDRALNLDISRRRSEIEAIEAMEVVDDRTLRISLSEPSVPLLAALSDRAGMIVSPAAGEELGEDFTNAPVCSGPYEFEEQIPQDRIVLRKFEDYHAADEYQFDRLVFRGIPDSTVRLLNLRSGQLDLIERLSATDVATVMEDPELEISPVVGLGYYGITFDIGGEGADPDFSQHAALREAFSLAIDRKAINDVVFDGEFTIGNQPFPPSSQYYDESNPVPDRDVEAARAKMEEAGVSDVTLELLVPTDSERQQVAQMIQAMLAEIGVSVEVQTTELMTLLDTARQGEFEAHLVGWSGRVDPDLNITPMLACSAAGNDAHYCSEELDQVLTKARATADVEERKAAYDEAIQILLRDLPIVYLYHSQWIYAHDAALKGFEPFPDGILRLRGVKLEES